MKTLSKVTDGNIETIQCLEVFSDGRYIVTVSFDDDIEPDLARDYVERLSRQLKEWWESGDKFAVFGSLGTAKFVVERINNESDN